jgi:hypothetical protein
LKGPLLEEQEKDIEEWKTNKLSTGLVCLTGDGWTNNRRVGCLNLEVISEHGPIHFDTIERTAQVTQVDAPYIAGIFNNAITALGGPERVAGVVSDNETKMRNVWEIVETSNPGVLALPCSAHIGSLLLKDICKLNWIATVLDRIQQISDHVLNHSFPLALFREKTAQIKELKGKDLKMPCKTRYGSMFDMAERSFQLRIPLRQMVVDEQYEICDAHNPQIAQWILSPNFWDHVDDVLKVLSPVYVFIRFVDGLKPDCGKVYENFREVGSQILNSGSTNAQVAYECFQRRINGTQRLVGFHHPAHSAAMLLHPHNWDVDFQNKYGHQDYAKIRQDFVQIVTKVSQTPEQAATAILQFDNEYRKKTLGTFQLAVIQQTAKGSKNAAGWWQSNALEIPELQRVAIRVLSLAIANSAAERNWSIHGFLVSKRRSRLGFGMQRKLVNLYVNLKLKEKLVHGKAVEYFSEEEGDSQGSESDIA